MDDTLTHQVTRLLAATIEQSTGRTIELADDTALIDEGYLDSLTLLTLFVKLQDTFSVELDVEDLTEGSFGTPRAIAALIQGRRR